MRGYYRVMLGKKSAHAAEGFAGGFVGADFGIDEDLTQKLPEAWREFNTQFIPVFLAKHLDKTKIGAGLACGALWTVSKGIRKGDLVLCPDGTGSYRVGEVLGDYLLRPWPGITASPEGSALCANVRETAAPREITVEGGEEV